MDILVILIWLKCLSANFDPIISSRAKHNVCRVVATKRLTLEVMLKRYLETRRTSSLYTTIEASTDTTAYVTQAPFQCGSMATDVEAAVIHGTEAPEKAWPWMVMLRGSKGHCGGVLLSDTWVLTAAHCLPGIYQIVMGKRNKQVRTEYEQHRRASREFMHPESNIHDMGLVLLDQPVEFSEYVRPACLPNSSISEYTSCYVCGFGVTNPAEFVVSQTLQQLKVRIMDKEPCIRAWLTVEFWLADNSICLDRDPDNQGSGICNGDSGSPLSCKHGNTFHVIAIASLVEKNCSKLILPDVYALTAPYAQWIKETIHSSSRSELTCDKECNTWVNPSRRSIAAP